MPIVYNITTAGEVVDSVHMTECPGNVISRCVSQRMNATQSDNKVIGLE